MTQRARQTMFATLVGLVLSAPMVSAGPMQDCASSVPATAIAGCTKILKGKLKPSDQSIVYTMRGVSFLNDGNPQSAIQDLEKAGKLNPKNFQAFQGLAFALQKTGLYPEAVTAFDKAIALNPSDHVTISYRGYAHLIVKDYTKALKDFDAAAKLAPKDATYQTARGDALKSSKAYPLAVAAYSKAIALNPDLYSAYEGRGLAHYGLLDIDAAIADFDQSLQLNPKASLSFAGRANARYLRNEIAEGMADAEMAIKLSPGDEYMISALGNGHLAKQDFVKAQALFEQAQIADGASLRALRGLAAATMEQDDADKALTLLDTALQQAPEEFGPYAMRGHIILSKGRVDEAIGNFEKALSTNNLDGVAYWGLGLAYAQKGDVEKARLNFQESLKPYRLYGFQQKRASEALLALGNSKTDELSALANDKTDTPQVATKGDTEQPVTQLPAIAFDPGKRVALVIGNSAYENANTLPNPTRDAKAIATALRGLGFEVIEGQDLALADMQGKLKDFAQKSSDADVALFYYAGHGMQVGDKNYLVPTDAKLKEATAVDFELVDVNTSVVQYLGGENRTGIIILDSCRDNPLSRSFSRSFGKTRSGLVQQGMAPMSADDGGLIFAFATSPGDVAEDGEGQNSPFTTALLAHMATPGIELEQMMKRVKKDVYTATNKRQQPWVNSALRDEIFLSGK
jgi:tetratricopeptide (TPR) repeat protein